MLSKKSQRNGAHYIIDLRTTGPWRVNGVVISRKEKTTRRSHAINDSARAKSHARNKPLLAGYKEATVLLACLPWELISFHANSATKICNFLFYHKACSPYQVAAD